jgi:hypothetical protein
MHVLSVTLQLTATLAAASHLQACPVCSIKEAALLEQAAALHARCLLSQAVMQRLILLHQLVHLQPRQLERMKHTYDSYIVLSQAVMQRFILLNQLVHLHGCSRSQVQDSAEKPANMCE